MNNELGTLPPTGPSLAGVLLRNCTKREREIILRLAKGELPASIMMAMDVDPKSFERIVGRLKAKSARIVGQGRSRTLLRG